MNRNSRDPAAEHRAREDWLARREAERTERERSEADARAEGADLERRADEAAERAGESDAADVREGRRPLVLSDPTSGPPRFGGARDAGTGIDRSLAEFSEELRRLYGDGGVPEQRAPDEAAPVGAESLLRLLRLGTLPLVWGTPKGSPDQVRPAQPDGVSGQPTGPRIRRMALAGEPARMTSGPPLSYAELMSRLHGPPDPRGGDPR